jgi:hypothetical protein
MSSTVRSVRTLLSARMPFTAEQHSLIAAAYDKAAFDVSLPAHTRAAFAKKAAWFRLLACIDEKLERGALNPSVAKPKGLGATADAFGFIAG